MNPETQGPQTPNQQPQIAQQTAQVIAPTATPQPSLPTEPATPESYSYLSHKIDTSSIYPDATRGIGDTADFNATQKAALYAMKSESAEVNRAVSMRAKSVLVVGIIMAIATLSSAYTLFTDKELASNGTFQTIVGVFVAIQALMTVYILLGNDTSTVSLILKILIVFQLIGLFSSLASPAGFVLTGCGLLLLFIANTSVKNLRN